MDQPPPIPNPGSGAAAPAQTSLAARLLNIFAIPGAVLDEVRETRHSAGNWILPIILAAITTAALLWLTFTNPLQLSQFREAQKQKVAEMVSSGKASQSEADQSLKLVEWATRPAVMKVIASGIAVAVSCLRVFGWAFILWFLGLIFLRTRLSFLKTVEIAGLASLIIVLGTLVTLVLTVSFGQSAVSSVSAADAQKGQDSLTLILTMLFNMWFVVLLSSGLARLAGVRSSQTMFLVMGTWLAIQLGLALVGTTVAGIAS